MKKFIKIFGLLTLSAALMNFASSCEEQTPDNPDQGGETFEPNTVINNLSSAVYTTEGETGIYNICLGTNLDRYEMPAEVGDMYISMYLYAPLDEDPTNAVLPSGTYAQDSTHAHMTWDPRHTVAIVKVSEGQEMDYFPYPLSEGTVYVSREGDEYTINVAFKLTGDETEVRAQYVGPITFASGGSSANDIKNFESDPNVTLESAYGTYYGSWAYPHADDITLRFRKNIYDENGDVIQSYSLTTMIFISKLADYTIENPQVPSGKYDVTMKKTPDMNNTPFTVSYGFLGDYMGELIPFGSSLMMTDYKEGLTYAGYFTGGSMTVANNDGEYDIEFNFITPEGLDITAHFNGEIEIENRCNNNSDPNYLGANGKPISSLTEHINLNIEENNLALIAHYGNYIFPDKAAWYFSLGAIDKNGDEKNTGDYIQTEFLKNIVPYADAVSAIPGTYTVSSSHEANTLLPGYSSFGNNSPFYTWYGDLGSYDNELGYNTKMAPIASGTMVIEDLGNGIYSFTFDFVDDAGYTVKGSWSGPADVFDSDLTIPVEGEEDEEDGGHQHKANIVRSMSLNR